MKRIFTLFAFVLMASAVFAAAGPRANNALTIRSLDRGDIRVIIDGRRFEPNDNSMVIRQMQAGTHSVKIYREVNNGRFNIFGKRYEVVYNTNIRVRNNTHVRITVDRHGRAMIEERRLNNGRNNRWMDNDDYRGRDNNGRDDDWEDDQFFDFDRDGRMGDYDDRPGYDSRMTMSDREFNTVLNNISKEWYEGNKLKSAQQVISTSYMSSAQVKQLLQLFTFEENKLSLAKQAYAKTVDQRIFLNTIGDVFSFNSSREDLARFVRNGR